MYDVSDDFEVTADGPVRIVRFNVPDKLNALSEEMLDELPGLWWQIQDDPDARAVVLTGSGRAFSAGGDFDAFERKRVDVPYRSHSLDQARAVVELMLSLRAPLVAAVNGPAMGLGCTLVTLCDVVFMSERAYLADPHVSIGLVAGDGSALTWPHLVSLLRAKQYILTGDRIPAEEAKAIGMANFVVPPDELMPQALAFAHRLAAQPPGAVQATKQLLNEHLVRSASSLLSHGLALEHRSFDSPEYAANIEAMRPGER